MPELTENMYCSQQICIPPTFPYLLRQFAKAAIRTQPNDLLKWACAYFRCLSLNIPPPVKPRLEYPIPKDYHGITPGWLKALLYQLQTQQTVPFKVLWDRWIGACLEHNNLIQLLCLGGFTDNMAVPFLRFLALCAATLTENLTQTMILICEILTEEPEGGSAMIPLHTFVDLYKFLAQIDASVPQTLKNYYFLDKFLGLFEEKIARDEGPKEESEESAPDEFSLMSSSSSSKTVEGAKKDVDYTSVVSCPSVPSEEHDNFMRLLMKVHEAAGEYEGDEVSAGMDSAQQVRDQVPKPEEPDRISLTPSKKEDQVSLTASKKEDQVSLTPSKKEDQISTTPSKKEDQISVREERASIAASKKEDQESVVASRRDDQISMGTSKATSMYSRGEELSLPSDAERKEKSETPYNERCLQEDLERLRKVQHELMGGESDDDIEKFKASLLAEVPLSDSQLLATQHYETKVEESSSSEGTQKAPSEPSVELEPEKTKVDYEEVFVEAIPGIGPKVPEKLMDTVCKYMTEVADNQHGVVMPRNIRHFECPPLEVIND